MRMRMPGGSTALRLSPEWSPNGHILSGKFSHSANHQAPPPSATAATGTVAAATSVADLAIDAMRKALEVEQFRRRKLEAELDALKAQI